MTRRAHDARALTRRPAFWIAYAALAAIALVVAWRLFPLAIPLVNLDITMSRARGARARPRRSPRRCELAPGRRAQRRALRARQRRRRTTSSSKAAARPAFAALVAGDVYAPYWWDVRLFKPGEVERGDRSASGRTARRTDSRGACRRPTCRDAATKALALDATPRARSPRSARTRDWSVDFAPYTLLEQSQQTRPTGRVDHAFVYERTTSKLGEARIRLRLDGHRRRAHRGRALRPRAGIVRAPLPASCAARTTRSPGVAALAAGAALRPRRLHPRRAVARCAGTGSLWRPALAGGLRRRRPARRGDARRRRRPRGSASTPRNRRRRSGCGRSGARGGRRRWAAASRYALVFMAAESLSRRAFPRPSAALARVVARGGADARGAGTHARRLPVRADRARAHRGVLLRDQPLARLVAALGSR